MIWATGTPTNCAMACSKRALRTINETTGGLILLVEPDSIPSWLKPP